MFENPGFFRTQLFLFGIRENSKSWMSKSQGKKSTIPEASTWPSRSAELYGRVCGDKLGTPGGKMGTAISHVLAFLEPRGTHLPSKTLISL